MTRDRRKQLIQTIQNERQSKVITYVTSDRPNLSLGISADVVPIIHEQILSLRPDDGLKLDLFIYSRGGDSDVPWSIVSMFREYCEEGSFSVLIPFRAHSAATVIALGADEIVMTKKAELGPIDITISKGPYNPRDNEIKQQLPISVEDVMGYFSLLNKVGCERPDEIMKGFELLSANVHPLVLGSVSRLLEQTQLVALRLLSTRANAFPEEQNREIVKRLSSEIYSHRHTISRSEAINNLQLNQIVKAEEANISEELWQLYCEYRDYLSLEEIYNPEEYLIENDFDEYKWDDLNLICVETENKSYISRRDIELKRIKQIPPQVNLNLNNLSFPQINLPNLPEGITTEEINQMIRQILPQIINPVVHQAAEAVTQEFIKRLPYSQFQRAEYNIRWDVEE